jgi:flagellar motor switch protein FliM
VSSETLSQQEIDLLFSGSGAAAPPPAPPAQKERRPADVQVYDFRRPNLISKDRLRALEAMYGLLCKATESWLTTRVRGAIDLRLLGVEHFSFGEFTLSLPNPSASYVFDVAGGGPQIVVDFGRDLAFFLVDRLLGSSGAPPLPDRALTVLERMVVRIAADQVAVQLGEIWKDHVSLGLTLNRFESVPEILRTANREDPMLVANIEVRAAQLEGTLLVCIPFAVVEKFFITSGTQRLQNSRGTVRDQEADRRAAEVALRKADVGIVVHTPSFQVGLRDVAALRAGDTICTGLVSEPPLEVSIEGTSRFRALAGRSGRTLAIRITETIQTGPGGQVETQGRTQNMATVMPGGMGKNGEALDLAELAQNGGGEAGALSSLFHVTLPVSIELGRARMSVQEVLELGRGSVVPLDRLVGEPVDVIVGDRRFAEGEVVVIGEQFGVRITRILAAPNGNGSHT